MGRYRFEILFGSALVALFLTSCAWQNPGKFRRKLSTKEIDRYVAEAEKLQMRPDMKREFLSRIRAWMEADDGRAFYNFNIMRYYPQLHRSEGDPPFDGTPKASNARYESLVAPMLLEIGGYPSFAGNVDTSNLVGYGPDVDGWHRIVIARYPSRRALMKLLANPDYQRVEPYKAMALDQLLLIPTNGTLVLPDLTWLVGGACLAAFLAAGWIRAASQR